MSGGESLTQAELDKEVMLAVWRGQPERLREWIGRGGSPNAAGRDSERTPALLVAVKSLGHGAADPERAMERRRTLEDLLSNGADPRARDASGQEALSLAAAAGELWAVQRLLESGASAMSACDRGWTAAHHAAKQGRVDVLAELIGAGGVLEAVNGLGETPLMVAAFYNEKEAVEMLLSHGADPERVDRAGLTALELSYETRTDPDCAALLRSAMEARRLERETGRPGAPAAGRARL